MIRFRPKPDLNRQKFKDWLASEAQSFADWIDLNVEAFDTDPKAQTQRLLKAADPKDGFRYFLETYLPHYVKGPPSLFHQAVFEAVPRILCNSRGCREQFIAPRGSSKSTHLTLGLTLYVIVLKLKNFPVILSDVYAQSALFVEAIKAELTTNPRLLNDFPDACGEGRVWREGEIVTKNNIRVQGFGALQKIRGRRHGPHRPDIVFMDDVENDEQVRSPEQRRKLDTWIKKAVLKLGPPDGSMDVIWAGTILHFDSVLARGARSPVWNTHEFRAIVKWPDDMTLWERFEEIYLNESEAAARAFYDDHRAAMDRGAVLNWPELQPLVFLMLERAGDHASFQSEYQNQPVSDDNPFQKIHYWVTPRSDLILFGAIDPSLGKGGKGRDPSAILIAGVDPVTQVIYLLEASIRRRLPDIIITDALALQRRYRCLLWFVEAIQFQEFLRTTLMKEAARAGLAMPTIPVAPFTDKRLRIERLQPPIAAGLIQLHASQTTLIDQLQQFPDADHDDGPDCLEMLWDNALKFAPGASAGMDRMMSAGGGSTDYDDYRLR